MKTSNQDLQNLQNYNPKSDLYKSDSGSKEKLDKKAKVKKEWDERFFLGKIPKYDAYKDVNYLSLALVKSKMRYEEKKKKEEEKKNKKAGRMFSAHYSIVSKANAKQKEKGEDEKENELAKTSGTFYNRESGLFFKPDENKESQDNKEYNGYNNINNNRQNSKKQNNHNYKNNNMIQYKFISSQNMQSSQGMQSSSSGNGQLTKSQKKSLSPIQSRTNYKFGSFAKKEEDFELPRNSPFIQNEELQKEFNEMNQIWNDLGINKNYQKKMSLLILSLEDESKINNLIKNEKKELKQIKSGIIKINKEIEKREDKKYLICLLDDIYYKNKLAVRLKDELRVNQNEQGSSSNINQFDKEKSMDLGDNKEDTGNAKMHGEKMECENELKEDLFSKQNKKKQEENSTTKNEEVREQTDNKNKETTNDNLNANSKDKDIVNKDDYNAFLDSKINETKTKIKSYEKEQENKGSENIYEKNKDKVDNDIKDCLVSLRYHGINIVNSIKKFRDANSFLIMHGKYNMKKANKEYRFDNEYLLKMQSDLNFLKNLHISELYNFTLNDPFLVSTSLTPEYEQSQRSQEFRTISINDELLNLIRSSEYILLQENILRDISKENEGNKKGFNQFGPSPYPFGRKVPDYYMGKFGNNFKGNLEEIIQELRKQKEYNNLFYNTQKYKKNIKDNNKNKNDNLDIEENNNILFDYSKIGAIPGMSSDELTKKFEEYERLRKNKSDLTDEMNKSKAKNNSNNNENKDDNNSKNKKNEPEDDDLKQIRDNLRETFKSNKKDLENDKYNEEKSKQQMEEEKIKKEQEEEEKKKREQEEAEKKKKEQEEAERKKKEQEEEERKKKEQEEEERKKKEQEEAEKKKKEQEEEERKKKEQEDALNQQKKDNENNNEIIEEDFENKQNLKDIEYKLKYYNENQENFKKLFKEYSSHLPTELTNLTFNNDSFYSELINPKILVIYKNENSNELKDKIYGICSYSYYFELSKNQKDQMKLILNINFLSILNDDPDNEDYKKKEKNINLLHDMIDKIKGLNNDSIQIIINSSNNKFINELKNLFNEFVEFNDLNESNNNKEILNKILKNTNTDIDNVKILRINNSTPVDSKLKCGLISYDNMSCFALLKKDDESENKTELDIGNVFYNFVNINNIAILYNKLSKDNLYKLSINGKNSDNKILSAQDLTLDNLIINNNCSSTDIQNESKNEIDQSSNDKIMYSFIKIKNESSLINSNTVEFNGILYNLIKYSDIKIKLLNNDNKLYEINSIKGDLSYFVLPLNDELYNNLFKENNKVNLYENFSMFLKNNAGDYENNEDSKDKVLCIPSFNIKTHLTCTGLPCFSDVDISDSNDNQIIVNKYDEIFNINFEGDNNYKYNIKIDLNNANYTVLKDKFLFGIIDKTLKDNFDVAFSSLVYITSDNFIKSDN